MVEVTEGVPYSRHPSSIRAMMHVLGVHGPGEQHMPQRWRRGPRVSGPPTVLMAWIRSQCQMLECLGVQAGGPTWIPV